MSESLNHSFSRFFQKPLHFKMNQVTAWVSRWIIQSFKNVLFKETLIHSVMKHVTEFMREPWGNKTKHFIYDCLRFIETDAIQRSCDHVEYCLPCAAVQALSVSLQGFLNSIVYAWRRRNFRDAVLGERLPLMAYSSRAFFDQSLSEPSWNHKTFYICMFVIIVDRKCVHRTVVHLNCIKQ